MQKPSRHILVCASFRATGAPQGICFNKGSTGLLQYLQEGLNDRGLDDVMISTTSCLKVCDRGPAMVVYPEGQWYGNITEDALEVILDALASNTVAEQYLIV
jgi:(2Fe-2S) ferredoxin